MWSKLQCYFQSQIKEIFSDPALRIYGLFLSGTQALSLYFMSEEATTSLSEHSFPVSWPGFLSSLEVRGALFWQIYLSVWAVVIILTVVGFWRKRTWGYFFLVLGFFMKGILGFQSYAFMGNYHYMPAILTLIFLFVSKKRHLISLFIVFFYLAAGLLKLNVEWLSGQALLQSVPAFLQPLGRLNFSLVVILELIVSWLLLFPHRSLRVFAFTSFVFFHFISWYWVGYFYPLIMLQLIAIFPLLWMFPVADEDYFSSANLKSYHFLVILLFWLAQILPFVQKTDSALTGDGRLWSLNMYDARSECFEEAYLRDGNEFTEINHAPLSAVRIHCDPIAYLDELKKGCQEIRALSETADITLFIKIKRKSDLSYTSVMELKNICQEPLHYSLFGWNQWLQK